MPGILCTSRHTPPIRLETCGREHLAGLAQTAEPTVSKIPRNGLSWKAGTPPSRKPHPATSCLLWGCAETMSNTSLIIKESDGWKDATVRTIQDMVRENGACNIIQGEDESSIDETEAPSSRVAVPGSPSLKVVVPRSKHQLKSIGPEQDRNTLA